VDLHVSSSAEAGRQVVTLTGSVDLASRALLTDAVKTAVADSDVTGIVLDLSGVEFIDSTGLGAVVESAGMAEDSSRNFALRSPSPRVSRILELTGLAEQWTIEDGGESRPA